MSIEVKHFVCEETEALRQMADFLEEGGHQLMAISFEWDYTVAPSGHQLIYEAKAHMPYGRFAADNTSAEGDSSA